MLRFRSLLMISVIASCVGCGETREARTVDHLTPELSTVVQSNDDFAWKLYGAASQAKGNLFFSPFSVSAAFAMSWAGAANDTASEMQNVLSIEGDPTAFHTSFGALIRDLSGEHQGRGYQLYVANRLFGQKGTVFQPAFLGLVDKTYGAPLDTVDYNDPSVVVSHINQWVGSATQNKIPAMLSTDDVDPSTRLVLADAIYFKASWATQFKTTDTANTPFTRSDGSSVDVPMMSIGEDKVRFGGDQDVQVLEKNYQDNELSMVVLLPQKQDGLPALEQKLTRDYVNGLIASEGGPQEVDVTLPRWELGLELPLKELLTGMGMNLAFDPNRADFSNMADPSAGPLYLGFAVHKAFVRVDEEGTEAAAATANGFKALSAPPSFVADHPFVYLIRDRLTGAILFVGRMDDPSDKGTL